MRRWALITAGAKGLGAAITRHLFGAGFDVLVHHHKSEQEAHRLEAEARAHGRLAHAISADLRGQKGREGLIAEAAAAAGEDGLHLLVHNLGVYPVEHLLDTSLEGFEDVFTLTCTTVFHATQLALPLLRKAKPPARIITIGDSGADRVEAHDDAVAYHIAKLGVHVLTRSYAQALAKDGITANMISPGFLENSIGTPGTEIPLRRMGSFDDITHALAFLISDQAAYISGANLVVSGGWNL